METFGERLNRLRAPLTLEEARKIVKSCQFMAPDKWSSKKSKQGRYRLWPAGIALRGRGIEFEEETLDKRQLGSLVPKDCPAGVQIVADACGMDNHRYLNSKLTAIKARLREYIKRLEGPTKES